MDIAFGVKIGKMIFTLAANLAFFLLAPLGSVSLVVGDWVINAFIVAKLVENFVPNGPAIVGNVSTMLPVLMNITRSAVDPFLQVNYTQILQENIPDVNMTQFTLNMKGYFINE